MTAQLLTNSRMSCYRACPKRHQLRYEVGIAPEVDAYALRVGTAYHAAQEAADLGLDIEAAIKARGDLDPYDAAMVAAMFTVHREVYAGQTLEVVATELEFRLPVRNPRTGAKSTRWHRAGKIDRLYRLPDGRLAISDHKTTTEDLTVGADLWQRLILDPQLTLYVDAARELGYDVSTILYDVARRPMHRPMMATPVADRRYTERASKLKDGTVRPAGSLHANQREVDETPEEFAARLADILRSDPARYYARYEIARLADDIDEVRDEVWSLQLSIREAQRSGRWFRNPAACDFCAYLGICRQPVDRLRTSPPEGFVLLDDVHPELSKPPVGGKPDQSAPAGFGGHATVAG